MYYLLCCAGEPLKDFPEWTVESCFLSSAIAYVFVSSRALLISALKSIENCQSGEISFAVGGPNEWARVFQTVCGMSARQGRGHAVRKTRTQFKGDTLQWRSDLGVTFDVAEPFAPIHWPVTSTLRLKQRSLLAFVCRTTSHWSPARQKLCQGQECFYLRNKSTNQ